MRLQITNNKFNKDGYWRIPIDNSQILLSQDSVYLFDQNGYHLTPTEMAYAKKAKCPALHRRHEWMLCEECTVIDTTLRSHRRSRVLPWL